MYLHFDRKATITDRDEEQMTREEIEPSRMSNAAPTMGFQHTSYFSMVCTVYCVMYCTEHAYSIWFNHVDHVAPINL